MRVRYPPVLPGAILALVILLSISCAFLPNSSKQVLGSSMEPIFHDGQVVSIEMVDTADCTPSRE